MTRYFALSLFVFICFPNIGKSAEAFGPYDELSLRDQVTLAGIVIKSEAQRHFNRCCNKAMAGKPEALRALIKLLQNSTISTFQFKADALIQIFEARTSKVIEEGEDPYTKGYTYLTARFPGLSSVECDARAAECFKIAWRDGNPAGAYYLGLLYVHGRLATKEDPMREAVGYLSMAWEHGKYTEAARTLAWIYVYGHARWVRPDKADRIAASYYALAYNAGNQTAGKDLVQLGRMGRILDSAGYPLSAILRGGKVNFVRTFIAC